jgi:single-strand DNA-binding protein
MVSFNRVVLAGNLTRDPELRFTKEGVPVAGFGLAVNRVRSKSDEVDFFDVSAWRELGEAIANYKKKGDPVLVEGRLQYRSWKAQDGSGAKRSKVDVVADNVQFLGSGAGEGGNGSSKGSAGSSAGSSRSVGHAGREEIDEESHEDIPFAQGYGPEARIVHDIL